MDAASEVVDRHTIDIEALKMENVVLQGSLVDCINQIEDLRMSMRLLVEHQIGAAPVINLTVEEEELVMGMVPGVAHWGLGSVEGPES